MTSCAILILPFLMSAVAFAWGSNDRRPMLLPLTGLVYFLLVLLALSQPVSVSSGWIGLDDIGRVVLLLVGILFPACAVHAYGYLRHEPEQSNRVFCGCLLAFVGAMTLLAYSAHLGLMWVAMEATTLASAPLICFHRSGLSLEATWKYLLICSVGIALALLGSFFLAYALVSSGLPVSLLFSDLLRSAPRLAGPWLGAAFVLCLVGYGTKMGLAPMHTWLPDAHGEAPAPISAMLSGALLPCAFLPILRVYRVCAAAGQAVFAQRILVVVGLLSIAVAGAFVIRQRDLKRMLAYSSVEHMGILALAIGIGGAATFGGLFHLITNGLTKCLLFLSTGNIVHAYGSKSTERVSGLLRRLPLTGAIFVAGFLAITGSPPFGVFLSEFTILNAIIGQGRFLVAAAFLGLLFIVFMGMGSTVLTAVQGRCEEEPRRSGYRDDLLSTAPILVLLVMVLLLGVWLPVPLQNLLHGASRLLEVRP